MFSFEETPATLPRGPSHNWPLLPRKPSKRKAKKQQFEIVVDGQRMLVVYEENWNSYNGGMGHFEYRSLADPPQRIPVSETGYRSHFVWNEKIKAAVSIEALALAEALAIMEEKSRRPADKKQLDLFRA